MVKQTELLACGVKGLMLVGGCASLYVHWHGQHAHLWATRGWG